jgi:hypothetical protein
MKHRRTVLLCFIYLLEGSKILLKKPSRRSKRAWFSDIIGKSETESERDFLAGEIDSVFLKQFFEP